MRVRHDICVQLGLRDPIVLVGPTYTPTVADVDATVAEGRAAVDPTLGDDLPMFRHRTRPEFLQTLPHVHGTSGFFVARLLVA